MSRCGLPEAGCLCLTLRHVERCLQDAGRGPVRRDVSGGVRDRLQGAQRPLDAVRSGGYLNSGEVPERVRELMS
ncbi:MAG: hypothetical protein JWL88_738 [Parcubacteria group bacterium]|nr:hypothetical protein [Parcubacteria group bacterium]